MVADMDPSRAEALILTGPTAIGKTALAVELALRHPYELISADSMQVFRGLEIGSGQPAAAELRGVSLHLCGVLDPAEPFNVRKFLDLCDRAHADIVARGRVPLYVGGTGLYLRALRWGIFTEQDDAAPDRVAAIRERLDARILADGPAALHAELARLDPESARRIQPNDPVRVVRALEVLDLTGRTMTDLQRQWAAPEARFPHRLVVLECPRPELIDRIHARVDAMIDAGWIEETRRLLEAGTPESAHCFKALGYAEILAHLRGELGPAAMIERIKARTRQFSRRQLTWFRREIDAQWVSAHAGTVPAISQIEKLVAARIGPH